MGGREAACCCCCCVLPACCWGWALAGGAGGWRPPTRPIRHIRPLFAINACMRPCSQSALKLNFAFSQKHPTFGCCARLRQPDRFYAARSEIFPIGDREPTGIRRMSAWRATNREKPRCAGIFSVVRVGIPYMRRVVMIELVIE
jgi:hypothetical protein